MRDTDDLRRAAEAWLTYFDQQSHALNVSLDERALVERVRAALAARSEPRAEGLTARQLERLNEHVANYHCEGCSVAHEFAATPPAPALDGPRFHGALLAIRATMVTEETLAAALSRMTPVEGSINGPENIAAAIMAKLREGM